ncbi:hypothetical protein FS842_003347 [Serendipita sp. 407]|nr:hypothetical protein FS842_003347 [Serendipita sp. 407]
MSTPLHPSMQVYQSFWRLLNAPGVHERTRAVFISLLANCEDEERLCSFVLHSVTTRVNAIFHSGLVHGSSYGLPAIRKPEELRVMLESEAVNDEARRWMADFLLYRAILGMMRGDYLLIRVSFSSSDRKTSESDEKSEEVVWHHVGLQTNVSSTEGVPQRRGSSSASTDVGRLFQEVELFPKSSDPVRISRFRNLVDVFHGGYNKALRDKNLASRANTVLIDRRWVTMFDNGVFHLRFDDEQIYPVPLWTDARVFIPTYSPINRSSSLRPRVKSVFKGPIGPDRELVSLHALILQTWHDTGLGERLVADMHLVDDMPSISQQVSVLGDSMFSQILQHRLALL